MGACFARCMLSIIAQQQADEIVNLYIFDIDSVSKIKREPKYSLMIT
jgi:hypothetical protein